MWDALQDAARTITLVLDKGCESHRKCPRCRGSGLLENAFTRLEKNEANPNQPCWFCEGVGALPIAGLNGFLLARATPCLKELDKCRQPCTEFMQLKHRRYGEKTTKFTNMKLGVDLADLFFDFSTSPWISHQNDLSNCTLTSLDCQQDVHENSKTKESIFELSGWKRMQQLHSSFSCMQSILRSESSERILNAPLDPPEVNSLESILSLPPSVSNLKPNGVLVMPVNMNRAEIYPVHDKLRGGFATRVSYTRKISYLNVCTSGNQQAETELTGHFISKPQIQTPCVLSTKGRRPVRKTRNCIRDKTRKAALERATGLMRTLRLHKEEPVSANFYEQPDCIEATSKSMRVMEAHGEQFSPSGMAPGLACLASVTVSRKSWFDRLIAIVNSKLWCSSQKPQTNSIKPI